MATTRLVRVGAVVHRRDCTRLPDVQETIHDFPPGDQLHGTALRTAVADRWLRVCTTCRPLAEGDAR